MEFWMNIAKYSLGFFIAVLFLLFLRYLAKTVSEAMNPPVPAFEQYGYEEPIDDITESVRPQSEILERVEMLTREEPVNIASIIRQWLSEKPVSSKRK